MTDNFSIPSFCCLFVSRLIETRNVGFFTFVFSQRYDFCDFDIGCSSVTIPNLALGVGQSFLCRREEVGHVFFINHISKCSGPPPPLPPAPYTFLPVPYKKNKWDGKGVLLKAAILAKMGNQSPMPWQKIKWDDKEALLEVAILEKMAKMGEQLPIP